MKSMNDMPDLNHVETFTPKLTPQEEVRQAYLEYMELRIKRLERALLAIQVEPWRAKEIASQALTGL